MVRPEPVSEKGNPGIGVPKRNGERARKVGKKSNIFSRMKELAIPAKTLLIPFSLFPRITNPKMRGGSGQGQEKRRKGIPRHLPHLYY